MNEAHAVMKVIEAVLDVAAPVVNLLTGWRRHESVLRRTKTLAQAHLVAFEDEASDAVSLHDAAVVRGEIWVREISESLQRVDFAEDVASTRICLFIVCEARSLDEDVVRKG